METSIAKAHAILDYLLTEAAISGKTCKSTYRIHYIDLKQSLEIEDFEFEDLDLQVSINLKWVEAEQGNFHDSK